MSAGASDGSDSSSDVSSSSSSYSSSDDDNSSSSSSNSGENKPLVRAAAGSTQQPRRTTGGTAAAPQAPATKIMLKLPPGGGPSSGKPAVAPIPAKKPQSSSKPNSSGSKNETSTSAAAASSSLCRVRNSRLSYSHPDHQPIPFPQLGSHASVIAAVDADRTLFPWGKYRYADYLVAAMDMFIEEVQADYTRQVDGAAQKGREYKRFTWGNKGELAICYALTMDMLKFFHDKLASVSAKPTFETMVEQCIHHLMRKSRIPTDVLTVDTYRTKFLDWKKGGTRYQGETHTSNVRFPSAAERLKKLVTLISTGDDYELQSTVVESRAESAPVAAPTTTTTTTASATDSASAVAVIAEEGSTGVATRGPSAGPGPLGSRVKAPPSGVAAVKQPMLSDGHQHLQAAMQWMSAVNEIKGNPSLLLLPKDRIRMVPKLIELCRTATNAQQYTLITDLISQSPVEIQAEFESCGGLMYVKAWLSSAIRQKQEATVRMLAERTASMSLTRWREATRAFWMKGNTNLDWLRKADIPIQNQPLWNDVVTRLEALAMPNNNSNHDGMLPSLQAGGSRKRERDTTEDHDTAEAAGSSSQLLAPAQDRTMKLSPEVSLISIEHCTALEASHLRSVLARRYRFAMDVQQQLEQRVKDALHVVPEATTGKVPKVVVPLWYNPYSLLGIPAAEVAAWL